ncbi:MAG: CaiB/BaiF CoA transferase family protein [Alphaproteobacteria bacterium]
MSGPLSGIKVLDLSSVVFGPFCTQQLGDLGADIIKIEAPEGDTTRTTGPRRSSHMAALFMGLNRNKRSIVLDLKKNQGQEALWRLIDNADVFIHSIRPQKIEKLGFGHSNVLARYPGIIYAGLHGYRADGPYAGQPAYDDVIQGQSGTADLMARLTGEPRYTPTIIADKTVGLYAANAISAALVFRERTGKGQFVEIPMYECMTAFNLVEHLFAATFDPPLEGGMGYTRVLAQWRRPYKTSDGHICMLAYTDPQWKNFWSEVGMAEMHIDPRFESLGSRSENINELYEIAGKLMISRTTDDWIKTLNQLEIPCARITKIEDLPNDPHLSNIGFFKNHQHPTEGDVILPDIPVRFSESPAEIAKLQPNMGEHSREILEEAGFSEKEISEMFRSGVTKDWGRSGR